MSAPIMQPVGPCRGISGDHMRQSGYATAFSKDSILTIVGSLTAARKRRFSHYRLMSAPVAHHSFLVRRRHRASSNNLSGIIHKDCLADVLQRILTDARNVRIGDDERTLKL